MIDVAVLGGGPAGAVAALTLAKLGLGVSVFEAAPGPRKKIGETLPPALRPMLARLELMHLVESSDHRPGLGNRSYWGSDQMVEENFLFGSAGPGWHLDRERFESELADAAIAAGARWHWAHHAVEANWVRSQNQLGQWSLHVEAPESLVSVDTRVVVDATGRRALFARGADAEQLRQDNLVGVAAVLEAEPEMNTSLESFTVVEAVEDGWWYSAPLTSGRVAVVFMTDGDLLDPHLVTDRSAWTNKLAAAPRTHDRLAGFLHASSIEPRMLAAGSACLTQAAGTGWLAVGDAAAAFDPLSSHGISSAMTTAYYGACAVAEHLSGSNDAFDAYASMVGGLFDDYLLLLRDHYAVEQRWPESPFWKRRQGSSLPPFATGT